MSERDRLQEGLPRHITNEPLERYDENPGGSVYEISNYYIRITYSRMELPMFIVWPHFVCIAVFFLVLSTLSITILFGSSKYFPLVNLVVSVLYFILFCEHDYVVRNSYPVVWSQPGFTETCKYAVGIMEKAKFRSRLFLFFYVIVFFYNGFWTLAAFDLLPK